MEPMDVDGAQNSSPEEFNNFEAPGEPGQSSSNGNVGFVPTEAGQRRKRVSSRQTADIGFLRSFFQRSVDRTEESSQTSVPEDYTPPEEEYLQEPQSPPSPVSPPLSPSYSPPYEADYSSTSFPEERNKDDMPALPSFPQLRPTGVLSSLLNWRRQPDNTNQSSNERAMPQIPVARHTKEEPKPRRISFFDDSDDDESNVWSAPPSAMPPQPPSSYAPRTFKPEETQPTAINRARKPNLPRNIAQSAPPSFQAPRDWEPPTQEQLFPSDTQSEAGPGIDMDALLARQLFYAEAASHRALYGMGVPGEHEHRHGFHEYGFHEPRHYPLRSSGNNNSSGRRNHHSHNHNTSTNQQPQQPQQTQQPQQMSDEEMARRLQQQEFMAAGRDRYHHYHAPVHFSRRENVYPPPNVQLQQLRQVLNARRKIDPKLLRLSMVNRDFNENDYEMLLSLDENVENRKGAAQEVIEGLGKFVVGANENTQCCICLSDMEAGEEARKLPCGHSFHVECIDRWLKINRVCPVDKKPVERIDVDDFSFEEE